MTRYLIALIIAWLLGATLSLAPTRADSPSAHEFSINDLADRKSVV